MNARLGYDRETRLRRFGLSGVRDKEVAILPSTTLSVSIDAPPAEVYDFASRPENLPRWAKGLGESVRKDGNDWIVETALGPMKIEIAGPNGLGVMDHHVTGPSVDVRVPVRVVANREGSEVLITVFRQPEMSDEQYAGDLAAVQRDLELLKAVVEDRKS